MSCELKFHVVEMLDEVLAVALRGVRLEGGKLVFDKSAASSGADPSVLIGQEPSPQQPDALN